MISISAYPERSKSSVWVHKCSVLEGARRRKGKRIKRGRKGGCGVVEWLICFVWSLWAFSHKVNDNYWHVHRTKPKRKSLQSWQDLRNGMGTFWIWFDRVKIGLGNFWDYWVANLRGIPSKALEEMNSKLWEELGNQLAIFNFFGSGYAIRHYNIKCMMSNLYNCLTS